MERLPFRMEAGLAHALGSTPVGDLEVCTQDPDEMPTLRFVLPRPLAERVTLTVRVRSRAGIPLASASVDLNPGDRAFETAPLVVLAMEGYSHVSLADRRAIERRVWSRRAFVTGSTA